MIFFYVLLPVDVRLYSIPFPKGRQNERKNWIECNRINRQNMSFNLAWSFFLFALLKILDKWDFIFSSHMGLLTMKLNVIEIEGLIKNIKRECINKLSSISKQKIEKKTLLNRIHWFKYWSKNEPTFSMKNQSSIVTDHTSMSILNWNLFSKTETTTSNEL